MQFWMIGEYERSLESLSEAQYIVNERNILNQQHVITYNVGRVYELQGKYEMAEKQFLDCLELVKQWGKVEDCLTCGLELARKNQMHQDYIDLMMVNNRLYKNKQDHSKSWLLRWGIITIRRKRTCNQPISTSWHVRRRRKCSH